MTNASLVGLVHQRFNIHQRLRCGDYAHSHLDGGVLGTMGVPMIGSDFVETTVVHSRRCGQCGAKMPKGTIGLASIKDGVVKKWLCSENCRLDFDDEIWQFFASRNAKRRLPNGYLPYAGPKRAPKK